MVTDIVCEGSRSEPQWIVRSMSMRSFPVFVVAWPDLTQKGFDRRPSFPTDQVATSEVDAYVLNIDGPNPGLNLYHVDVTTGGASEMLLDAC